jgi:hypothetical protein
VFFEEVGNGQDIRYSCLLRQVDIARPMTEDVFRRCAILISTRSELESLVVVKNLDAVVACVYTVHVCMYVGLFVHVSS